MIEFKMPSLGADMEVGTLVEWRKKIGDLLKQGDIIADVDTQKGLIEIEVFDDGILDQMLVKEGEKVPVGTVLALIKPLDGEEKNIEGSGPLPEIKEPKDKQVILPVEKRLKITPLAKIMAIDNKIDYSQLNGTGPEGEIVKRDIEKAIEEAAVLKASPKEEAIIEPLREDLEKKNNIPSLRSIRAAVAAAMSKSKREIPHYYVEKKIDLSIALEWLRKNNEERSVQKRLLPAALYIKALASAIDEVPDINGVWEDELIIKNEINIGFVISLRGGGIIVPSIKNADLKSIDEIMEWINDIIPRARAFKLRSSDLSEATITLTNLGEGGADRVFGIIYPPQVAIIGLGNVLEEAFAENAMMGIRPVIYATLAGDHRATDGLIGSRFLSALDKNLQNPDKL
ncbi:dihydrolipoamide acetyltransferase family protein [Echinicola shivajiensis]|uniref:dihydrolipoamide acetyltransferase family protein n=1 Tax=Echinicola shivajiensis TaxID=1035916 RepID=UPI001BFC82B6|nr:dihydrolipoamide acetyltransferase family protein [Echinicola shivajiensis]